MASHESARSLTVCIDESGNTGDAAASMRTAFGGQRVFALVGVSEDAGNIASLLSDLRDRHDVRAAEFKTRTMNRHPGFVRDLVRHLADRRALFVEVMDKKFFLAAMMTSFTLRGAAFDPFAEQRLANAFADAISERVEDSAVIAYAAFGEQRDQTAFEEFLTAFRSALIRAKLAARGRIEFDLLTRMERTLEVAIEQRGKDFLSFLPPPDRNSKGRLVPMLPHVQAFANLVGRTNLAALGYRGVRLVHDQQVQFEDALRDALAIIEARAAEMEAIARGTPAGDHVNWSVADRVQLEFADSLTEPGVQAADVVARFCLQRLVSILAGTTAREPADTETLQSLRNMGTRRSAVGVNIVSTTRTADAFWVP